MRSQKTAIESEPTEAPIPDPPLYGYAYRSIPFGITKGQFYKIVSRDPEIKIDNSHGFPLYSTTLFGWEFWISNNHFEDNGLLYGLQLAGEGLFRICGMQRGLEVVTAVNEMFTERFGSPQGMGVSAKDSGLWSKWNIIEGGGKSIETVVKEGGFGYGLFILITSTAMEAEAAAAREAENKANYSKYSADF
ncbi:MAG: hypothetical protein WBI82_01845 [Sphaerochaeta sp.]